MTEEEAKTKWCPLANAVATVPPAVAPAGNRGVNADASIHPNPPWARCIGSACMAWRWNEGWVSSAHDPVAGTITTKLKDGSRLQGGCGLAGAPQ